jgi:hypothetical protein
MEAAQFRTNKDVTDFLGINKGEFIKKFSFEEQLFLSLALIDYKDDGRLNPSTQKRIVEMDHSMKWNKKHIEKDLYDLLNTSHRNKYLFSDIVASYSIYKQDKVKQDNDLKLFQENIEIEVQTYATDMLNILLQWQTEKLFHESDDEDLKKQLLDLEIKICKDLKEKYPFLENIPERMVEIKTRASMSIEIQITITETKDWLLVKRIGQE